MQEIRQYARFWGRTFPDEERGAEFFNWTCAGFEVRFTGGVLKAELFSASELAPLATDGTREEPWIAVFPDGATTPSLRFGLTEPRKWYTLYENSDGMAHTVRVVKLTEGAKGKTGLSALECESLEPLTAAEPSCRLEFIGDSITCGFGDEAAGRESPFCPAEENGWITYAALAARKLNADFSCVCVSGIPLTNGSNKTTPFRLPVMEELYEFTDRLYEMSRGKTSGFKAWDFSRHPVDAICLNLGTNDVRNIRAAKDRDAEEEVFRARYVAFLEQIRRLNGPGPEICCLLGPMDYFLYDVIRDAVERYRSVNGDRHVHCFKFLSIDVLSEGLGAVDHPSAATHARMADELCDLLRPLLNGQTH
jgi:hypothetical protein